MNSMLQGQSGWCRQILNSLRARCNRRITGLRMTPMIDVIFLLLTFFVLTAHFREPEAFLEMNLPRAQSASAVHTAVIEPIILEIHAAPGSCKVHLADGRQIQIDQQNPEAGLAVLAGTFLSLCQDQYRQPNDPVEIYCHDLVAWELLVKVYDVLYTLGAEQITLGTIQEP